MKLLFCTNCSDILNLNKTKLSKCSCGQVEGKYVDNITAFYSGETAIPIGFNSFEFINAIKNQPENGKGKEFTSFVIPKNCETFKKQKNK